MKQYIDNIQEFANEHKIVFEPEGECGFGRPCVGLMHGENYVDYNPNNDTTYESIPEYYDERLNDIPPKDAYHKHSCLAVLGRGEEAIKQLSEWVDKLKELDATVVTYETGATGIQVMVSGLFGKTVKLNSPKP